MKPKTYGHEPSVTDASKPKKQIYQTILLQYSSSGETNVFMRHLVFVTLKQVDSLKLQVLTSQNEGCYIKIRDRISIKFLFKLLLLLLLLLLFEGLAYCLCAQIRQTGGLKQNFVMSGKE